MKKKKEILNICFVIISTIFFLINITKFKFNLEFNLGYFILFVVLYLISHLFRFIRMCVIYVEEKKTIKELFKIYILTTYVNFFIPLKLGELFRIYKFSNFFDNFGKGFVGVWVDRFFDTLMLTLILVYGIGVKHIISYILIISLLVFLLFSVFCYLCFNYTYIYVNRIILTKSETKKGIYILNFIESIKKLYNYAKYLLIGKTPILFFISILVWIFEISSYSLFAKSFNLKFNLFMIPEILSYRISNLSNFSNLQIILSCIIFLISIIVFFMNFINKFSKNKRREKV